MASYLQSSPALPADTNMPAHGFWGDQGDGTYINPVLPADFSDIDAIRVGPDYYAISSTFQYSPGMAVLHSKDLVNWTVIGHAVSDLTQIGPELNWDRMNRAGRGIWAGAIRFHDGKYWVYFNTPDEGMFMTTAPHPAGPWEPLHCLWRTAGWDDPCPFWDDDGQGYLVTTNFADGYKIHLFKLSPDGRMLLKDTDKVIHQSKGSEASKLYKIHGLYYHFYSEVHPEGRVAMMERAANLDGPWETRQLNHVNKQVDKEPNQGGLMVLPDGQWQFLTHQGRGDWEGRAACLLPVTWIDGWPIIGSVGMDGIGSMVWHAPKPISSNKPSPTHSTDEFNSRTLGPQWEWSYQPRMDHWSLTERPGALRLHAFEPLTPGSVLKAGNTLTQRAMRTSQNAVTVKLGISGMSDGQQAGIVHYAATYCTLGISQNGDKRTLTLNNNGRLTTGPVITQSTLWLRSEWDYDGQSQFSYSLNGRVFHPFGAHYPLTWGSYRGDRIGLFTFTDTGTPGYVDIESFQYTVTRKGIELVSP